MRNLAYSILVVGSALLVTLVLFAGPLARAGARPVTPLENIRGIPFPAQNNKQIITEELAHADVFLRESVLAKKLTLTITFHPGNLERLGVGLRENDFWLSYSPIPFDLNSSLIQTITLPLTDKLQEKDQSLDLMFFAKAKSRELQWELISLTAATAPTIPTKAQLKDYLRSIITKERAL